MSLLLKVTSGILASAHEIVDAGGVTTSSRLVDVAQAITDALAGVPSDAAGLPEPVYDQAIEAAANLRIEYGL